MSPRTQPEMIRVGLFIMSSALKSLVDDLGKSRGSGINPSPGEGERCLRRLDSRRPSARSPRKLPLELIPRGLPCRPRVLSAAWAREDTHRWTRSCYRRCQKDEAGKMEIRLTLSWTDPLTSSSRNLSNSSSALSRSSFIPLSIPSW